MNARLCALLASCAVLVGMPAMSSADVDGDGVADSVDVCCNTPPGTSVDAFGRPVGDIDADCDVDLIDFAMLATNLTGPLAPVTCPSCSDSVLNGSETDVDCGGGACAPCVDGLMCLVGSDCVNGVCLGGFCQAPSCTDSMMNGSETDVDCGGGSCPQCVDGQSCVVGADCTSGVCGFATCQAATCSDGIQNGGESGVDCGGPCPVCPQPNGSACAMDSECMSNLCRDGVCCNSNCSGTCFACNLPGSIGFCSPIMSGDDPDNECAGPSACNGSGGCAWPLGQPCGVNGQCLSGICRDGFCCDSNCLGTCEACDVLGSEGMCSFIPDGEDPDDECSFPTSCNGSGGCGL